MAKPATLDGYGDEYTLDCERVLVTLLRGLGPWKDSVYLVGGLTPRYLVPARPPVVPAHAGTLDVDIVIDLQILADTDAYHTLEESLKRMGFARAENEQGVKLSWRWQTRTEHGALMVLELLADAPQIAGGRVQPLPTEGTISALNIPHSSIVFDLYQVAEISAELLGGNGVATERVKHADIVSFTCLKAFAFDQRFERKDAHDLVYCIEHAPEGLDSVVAAFDRALAGKHAAVVREALDVLRRRFADDDATEGYRKDGPVSVAKFELGEGQDPELREARVLRQRQASDLIDRLLAGIG
ncbi:MAG: antitoxin [Steroidobacteraceae bacterium]